MKNGRQSGLLTDMKAPRVKRLADYYGRAEAALADKVRRSKKRYKAIPGNNHHCNPSLWLSCIDADAILDESGLKNPLFKESGIRDQGSGAKGQIANSEWPIEKDKGAK